MLAAIIGILLYKARQLRVNRGLQRANLTKSIFKKTASDKGQMRF